MMATQKQVALDAVDRMEATITEDLLLTKSPPIANWMEFFKSVRIHVLFRFGMWDEIKRQHIPENANLYCVTVAMKYYGKAIAWAATGNVGGADTQRGLFPEASKRVPRSRLNFPNRVVNMLRVATAMLDGEIEYRRGDYDAAFKSFRLAIECDDSLVYGEPWGWMLPTRHPYAELLLEQGHVQEAATVYAEDLGLEESSRRIHQNPINVWALHGYHECLVRLGRTAEEKMVERQLRIAAVGADVAVSSSCFCRLSTCCSSAKKCRGTKRRLDEL